MPKYSPKSRTSDPAQGLFALFPDNGAAPDIVEVEPTPAENALVGTMASSGRRDTEHAVDAIDSCGSSSQTAEVAPATDATLRRSDSGAPKSGPVACVSNVQSFDDGGHVRSSGAPDSAVGIHVSNAATASAAPTPVAGIDEQSEPATRRVGAPDSGVQGTITQSAPLSIDANSDADSLPEIATEAAGSDASGRRVLDDGTRPLASVDGMGTKQAGERSEVRSIGPSKVAAYSQRSRAKFLERGMSEVRARVSKSAKAWVESVAKANGVSVKEYLGAVIEKHAKRRTHGN